MRKTRGVQKPPFPRVSAETIVLSGECLTVQSVFGRCPDVLSPYIGQKVYVGLWVYRCVQVIRLPDQGQSVYMVYRNHMIFRSWGIKIPRGKSVFSCSVRKFVGIRQTLTKSARAKGVQMHQKDLLTSPTVYKDLAAFCRSSFRFY